ncbi:MAG: hypothetical protein ACYCUC_01700 [Candidatus Dormibacteria bacterium]
MPQWEHRVQIAQGRWFRGPLNARSIQRVLQSEEADGWELVSAVPVTQLGFTSAVWLLFKRQRPN